MPTVLMGKKVLNESVRVSSFEWHRRVYGLKSSEANAIIADAVLQEEITNTMRNAGATKVSELVPEMCGLAGPWVGGNRPPYAPKI